MKIFEKFRRVTSGQSFIPEIDGLRFVSMSSVFCHHMYGQLSKYYGVHVGSWPGQMLTLGHRGVELFFVISGFILARPFALHRLKDGPKVNLKSYFLRRVTRLEPPYILNLLICFALLIILNHLSARSLIPHLLASMCYLHDAIYGYVSTINPVAWSLEVEIQFYCLVPFLAFIFTIASPDYRRIALTGIILVCGFVQMHMNRSPRELLSIADYLQFFLMGFLLCDFYLLGWSTAKSSIWDVISCIGWPLIFLVDGLMFVKVVMPFLILLLYVSAFRGPLSSRFFRHPVITTIGGMCYTIYLFHFLIIAAVTRVLGYHGAPLVVILACVMATLTGCSIYYLMIERPCMDKRWPRKLWQRIRASLLNIKQ